MTQPLQSTAASFALLPHSFVIEVAGTDATKIVNNLCTNDILKLAEGSAVETFVTDLRGWVVAHGVALKLPGRILLLGSHPEPTAIGNHIDRYIIREDARVSDWSALTALILLDRPLEAVGRLTSGAPARSAPPDNQVPEVPPGIEWTRADMPVWGTATTALIVGRHQLEQLTVDLQHTGLGPCSADEFALRRIANFWPLSPQDIGDKAIPQELDRDASAISFTKGCYLGQETIARLDARGQLQKKLALLEVFPRPTEFESHGLVAGETVLRAEKEVGRLTSIAVDRLASRLLCLAMLRRGNFEPGTELTCRGLPARVLGRQH